MITSYKSLLYFSTFCGNFDADGRNVWQQHNHGGTRNFIFFFKFSDLIQSLNLLCDWVHCVLKFFPYFTVGPLCLVAFNVVSLSTMWGQDSFFINTTSIFSTRYPFFRGPVLFMNECISSCCFIYLFLHIFFHLYSGFAAFCMLSLSMM